MVKTRIIMGMMLVTSAALAASINFGGYLQPRWEGNTGRYSNFGIRRAYLGAGGAVTEKLSYRILLTMPGESISLFDAYVEVEPFRGLSLRAGQFQQPIGMEKLRSSSVILFPERTYASGFTIDRDIGLMASGGLAWITAQVGVFNGEGRNVADQVEGKDICGRLVLEPWEFLHLGAANQMGRDETADSLMEPYDFNRWGAELALTPWDLRLAAELMGGRDDTTGLMTWYVEAAWLWVTDAKYLYGIQPAARYEYLDPDTKMDENEETRITGGLNIHILPDHRTKLALAYRLEQKDGGETIDDLIIAQLQLKFP